MIHEELNEKQQEMYDEWLSHIKAIYGEYGHFTWKISPTGIGSGIIVYSHNTKTDTTSYTQKNSMTQLSWGEAKNLVGQNELIGKTAKIYKDQTSKNVFTLIIE